MPASGAPAGIQALASGIATTFAAGIRRPPLIRSLRALASRESVQEKAYAAGTPSVIPASRDMTDRTH